MSLNPLRVFKTNGGGPFWKYDPSGNFVGKPCWIITLTRSFNFPHKKVCKEDAWTCFPEKKGKFADVVTRSKWMCLVRATRVNMEQKFWILTFVEAKKQISNTIL